MFGESSRGGAGRGVLIGVCFYVARVMERGEADGAAGGAHYPGAAGADDDAVD